jgi:hypothetical protein
MTSNQKRRPAKQFLIATTALFLVTASLAHAETLTMICGTYSVAFSPGSLTSHAPKKDVNYPITKVDRQNGRTVVSGKTKYGKITAFFSKDGHSSIVWTNGKDVVLNQCASETVPAPQPPLQAMPAPQPPLQAVPAPQPPTGEAPIPMPKAPKQEEKKTEPIIIGGDERVKACGDTGEIVGLDPQGDGFLSVRSGPGGQPFQEKDRLFNGNEVSICARSGPWLAVVYSDQRGLEQICGVDKPWRTRQPYTGPCRYGWIHSTHVRIAEAKQEPRSPDSQAPPPVPARPENPAPRRDDDINEADFISVISAARGEYNSGSNDMVKGAARAHRRVRLCQLVQGMDMRGWTGRITNLSSSSSGKGVLGISIGPHITITTVNNDFSDSFDHTLIDPSSNVFREVVPLSVGQQILFSGSFLPSDTDCVREISLRQEGSMTDPEFLFHFTDVKAVQ